MTINPAGGPLWARTAEIEQYGGATEKQNYLNRSAIDPLVDVDATQFARLTADAAGTARTTPFCTMTIKLTASGAPMVQYVHSAVGVRLVEYAGDSAPTGFPSVARNGTSDISVTFDSSYTDAYGVSAAYVPRHPKASVIFTSVCRAVCSVTGNVVRVKVFDATDTPITEVDPLAVTLTVW